MKGLSDEERRELIDDTEYGCPPPPHVVELVNRGLLVFVDDPGYDWKTELTELGKLALRLDSLARSGISA